MALSLLHVVFAVSLLPFNQYVNSNGKFSSSKNYVLTTAQQTNDQPTKIQEGDSYYVKASRAYFYTQPAHQYINTKKYLIRGDYCEVLRYKNGFGYVNYYNTYNYKTTSGWLNLENLTYTGGH
jgi:hypothetical protein